MGTFTRSHGSISTGDILSGKRDTIVVGPATVRFHVPYITVSGFGNPQTFMLSQAWQSITFPWGDVSIRDEGPTNISVTVTWDSDYSAPNRGGASGGVAVGGYGVAIGGGGGVAVGGYGVAIGGGGSGGTSCVVVGGGGPPTPNRRKKLLLLCS